MAEEDYKRLQSRVTKKVYRRMRRAAKRLEYSDSRYIREAVIEKNKREEAKVEDEVASY